MALTRTDVKLFDDMYNDVEEVEDEESDFNKACTMARFLDKSDCIIFRNRVKQFLNNKKVKFIRSKKVYFLLKLFKDATEEERIEIFNESLKDRIKRNK